MKRFIKTIFGLLGVAAGGFFLFAGYRLLCWNLLRKIALKDIYTKHLFREQQGVQTNG